MYINFVCGLFFLNISCNGWLSFGGYDSMRTVLERSVKKKWTFSWIAGLIKPAERIGTRRKCLLGDTPRDSNNLLVLFRSCTSFSGELRAISRRCIPSSHCVASSIVLPGFWNWPRATPRALSLSLLLIDWVAVSKPLLFRSVEREPNWNFSFLGPWTICSCR